MKSSFPYLVDIAITERCEKGCPFCYASSVKEGRHADLGYITKLLNAMLNVGVFEVVFGGGEPTLHPQLKIMVEQAKLQLFKVGITTKNYAVTAAPTVWPVLKEAHSVAFSCNTVKDWNDICAFVEACNVLDRAENERHDPANANYVPQEAIPTLPMGDIGFNIHRPDVGLKAKVRDAIFMIDDSDGYDYARTQRYIQVILGIHPFEETMAMLKAIMGDIERTRLYWLQGITFLGFKNFGFGTKSKQYELPADWVDQIAKLHKDHGPSIGADAVLVNKYRKEMSKLIPQQFLVGVEGESSCYIDAVRKTMKTSSYTEKSFLLPFPRRKWNDRLGKFEMANVGEEITSREFLQTFARV